MTTVALVATEYRLKLAVAKPEVSRVSRAVLRAVSLGVRDAGKLRGLLALPKEVLAQVLVELLRQNRLLLNLRDGELVLPPASGSSELGAADSLAPTDTRSLTLCYLPQLGAFLPKQPLWRATFQRGWLSLPVGAVRPSSDIGRAELLEAASRFVTGRVVVRDVVEATADPAILTVEMIRYVSGSTAHVYPYPREPRTWSKRDIALLDDAMVEAREGFPRFWDAIETASGPPAPVRVHPLLWLRGLRDVSTAVSTFPDSGGDHHALVRLVRSAAAIVASASQVDVVAGVDNIRSWIERSSAGAREMVLTAPFANSRGVEWLENEIIPRLTPGAEIAVGIGMARDLNEDDARLMKRLSGAGYRHPVHAIVDFERGGASHAKCACVDRRQILVGSCNFLSSPVGSDGKFECALAVASPSPAAVAGALSCLPPPVRAHLADAAGPIGVAAGVDLSALRGPSGADPGDTGEWLHGVAVALEDGRRDDSATLKGVSLEVSATIDRVQAELTRVGATTVQVVTVAEHRPLLFDALDAAERLVLVASHRISHYAADARFVERVRAAVQRPSCRVVVIWGEQGSEQDPVPDVEVPTSLGKLRTLRAQFSDRFFMNDSPIPWHAKVLVCDSDVCAVGSYEYLNLVARERRGVTELSLLCGGASVVAQLCGAVVRYVTRVDPVFGSLIGSAVRDSGIEIAPLSPL